MELILYLCMTIIKSNGEDVKQNYWSLLIEASMDPAPCNGDRSLTGDVKGVQGRHTGGSYH